MTLGLIYLFYILVKLRVNVKKNPQKIYKFHYFNSRVHISKNANLL